MVVVAGRQQAVAALCLHHVARLDVCNRAPSSCLCRHVAVREYRFAGLSSSVLCWSGFERSDTVRKLLGMIICVLVTPSNTSLVPSAITAVPEHLHRERGPRRIFWGWFDRDYPDSEEWQKSKTISSMSNGVPAKTCLHTRPLPQLQLAQSQLGWQLDCPDLQLHPLASGMATPHSRQHPCRQHRASQAATLPWDTLGSVRHCRGCFCRGTQYPHYLHITLLAKVLK